MRSRMFNGCDDSNCSHSLEADAPRPTLAPPPTYEKSIAILLSKSHISMNMADTPASAEPSNFQIPGAMTFERNRNFQRRDVARTLSATGGSDFGGGFASAGYANTSTRRKATSSRPVVPGCGSSG